MTYSSLDLDAYLERIGYSGPRTPTLDTLSAVHRLHPQAIPFENLNPFLGWPVQLDLPSLERKLVRERRGGYCYEHNLLFMHVLAALGFQVTGLGARVLWNMPAGVVNARTHMLLLIALDERAFVADVGFGGLTLTAPLQLQADLEQATPHEPFRLKKEGGSFVVQARIRDEWKPLYLFDLQEQVQADYELTSWYLWNHPESRFVRNLVAARVDDGRRYALFNNELAIHHIGGGTERRAIADPVELGRTLERVFEITLPSAPEVPAALRRVATGAAYA